MKYNFLQCHILNPVGVVCNSSTAKSIPYSKYDQAVSNTDAIMNILSVLNNHSSNIIICVICCLQVRKINMLT